MVFEHQMHLMNLLTTLTLDVKRGPGIAIRDAANEIADYMLFVDEAPLGGPVAGTSGFAEMFAARGPRDSNGRSLRQFDLKRRLMRYPCSYMIYSEAFDALPEPAREAIYKRMWQILSGEDKAAKYARFLSSDRQAIVEI